MAATRIDRINELARKSREAGLTEDEKAEQARLRQEYLADFRRNLEGQLGSTYLVDEKGNRHKLERIK